MQHFLQFCQIIRVKPVFGAPHDEMQIRITDVIVIQILLGRAQTIRAPPLAENMTSGRCLSTAYSMAQVIFSPTAILMLPIKKRLSSTATTVCTPPDFPRRRDGSFLQPGLDRGGCQFFLVVREVQHILRGYVGVQLLKCPVIQNRAEPIIGADCQMHPAVGADILAFDPHLPRGTAPAFFHSANCGDSQLGAAVPASRRAFS